MYPDLSVDWTRSFKIPANRALTIIYTQYSPVCDIPLHVVVIESVKHKIERLNIMLSLCFH